MVSIDWGSMGEGDDVNEFFVCIGGNRFFFGVILMCMQSAMAKRLVDLFFYRIAMNNNVLLTMSRFIPGKNGAVYWNIILLLIFMTCSYIYKVPHTVLLIALTYVNNCM